MASERVLLGLPRNIEIVVSQGQIKRGMELLETAASEYSRGQERTWTANDVISSLDLPLMARDEIIQGFFAKADGTISYGAMRKTLKMIPLGKNQELDPFNYHWERYLEAKARKLSKTSSLTVIAAQSA